MGAGTIIKDGFRVRGLTTAASLWVVACVGLAIGSGLYELSIAAALLIFITLVILKKIETIFSEGSEAIEISIDKSETSIKIAKAIEIMKQMDVQIKNIKMSSQDETTIQGNFLVKIPRGTTVEQVYEKLKSM